MAVFNEPLKWATNLGKDADVVTIPDTAGDTDPDIEKIFPAVFSIPLANGGKAVPRKVLNALFKLVGDWSFYYQNGGIASYSSDLDYVVGRVILYTDNNLYKCIQANGASSTVVAPDNVSPLGSDYWVQVATLADFANYAKTDLSNIDNTAKIAIAHNAMPSNVYDELTLGANGTSYTAPADGYFYLRIPSTATNQYLSISHTNSGMFVTQYSSASGQGITGIMPVAKGDNISIYYTLGGSSTFKFVYAIGSESEQ